MATALRTDALTLIDAYNRYAVIMPVEFELSCLMLGLSLYMTFPSFAPQPECETTAFTLVYASTAEQKDSFDPAQVIGKALGVARYISRAVEPLPLPLPLETESGRSGFEADQDTGNEAVELGEAFGEMFPHFKLQPCMQVAIVCRMKNPPVGGSIKLNEMHTAHFVAGRRWYRSSKAAQSVEFRESVAEKLAWQ